MKRPKARCYVCLAPIDGRDAQVAHLRTGLRIPLAVYVCSRCAARIRERHP